MSSYSHLLVPLLGGLAAMFLVYAIGSLFEKKGDVVVRRLHELEKGGQIAPGSRKRSRAEIRARALGALQHLGENVRPKRGTLEQVRMDLVRAGFRASNAVSVYSAGRLVLGACMGLFAAFVVPFLDTRIVVVGMAVFYFLGIGWYLPRLWIRFRIGARQAQIRKALPDVADLLVVCVEAGLGLNQALMRVSEEIGSLSPALGIELATVNLEIRANTPRDVALRNLADRTGLDDLRSLSSMLIQAERFGTSVAQALRVYSESLRLKRRQRAEEAAAKTTVKLVLPLVFFVFPALFVILLGPAGIQMMEQFKMPPR